MPEPFRAGVYPQKEQYPPFVFSMEVQRGRQAQRAQTHQFTEYHTTRRHAWPTFSGCYGVFGVLNHLFSSYVLFSQHFPVHDVLTIIPWHQPSEVGVISILPEEETPLKSLPFPRRRSGFLSAAAWFWQRPLCSNELLPLLLPSERPCCVHHLCDQNAMLVGRLHFCFSSCDTLS